MHNFSTCYCGDDEIINCTGCVMLAIKCSSRLNEDFFTDTWLCFLFVLSKSREVDASAFQSSFS